MHIKEDKYITIRSSAGKALIFNTALLLPKSSRDSIGVQVMTLRGKNVIEAVESTNQESLDKFGKYISSKIPAAGIASKEIMNLNQLKLENAD